MKSMKTIAAVKSDRLAFLVKEIHHLDTQIHEYLRLTPQTMAIIAGVTGVVVSTPAITSEEVRHGILLAAPILIALTLVYHFNVATEVAARAEQRDKLSTMANELLGIKTFITGDISELLRTSVGSIIAGLLLGTILISVISVGIVYAWNTPWREYQLFTSILAISTFLISLQQIFSTRNQTKKILEEIYTTPKKSNTSTS